jgi:hypothetical protein
MHLPHAPPLFPLLLLVLVALLYQCQEQHVWQEESVQQLLLLLSAQRI